MGYVGVKGGSDAIINSEVLIDYYRTKDIEKELPVSEIKNQFRLAVDRVMSEGSLYDRLVASIALKQAEGDVLEATYLVRAFRSTLPRIGYTVSVNSKEMFLIRRISSAFQDIPWGQVLGPSRDYTQRLINFNLMNDEKKTIDPPKSKSNSDDSENAEKVIDYLRNEGLLDKPVKDASQKPYDITRENLTFPLDRSARLQRLSRGEEGAILAFGYASMRGWGSVHPTIAEIRIGYLPVKIIHPHWNIEVSIGNILATEVDSICSFTKKEITVDDKKIEKYVFSLGYGFVFGQNDRKGIAMSILDRTLSDDEQDSPVQDQEFVLLHIDGMESQGFISHLKLPHYVTFQSALDRLRNTFRMKKSRK